MRVEVTISVDYDGATVENPRQLTADLEYNLSEAIGNGILTGPNHEVIVDEYNLAVKQIT